MKGLFIKDWRLMSRQARLMLVFVLVFLVLFSATLDNTQFLSGLYTMIFVFLPMNCFAYDEMCQFDKFAACSPLPVSKIVLTRYLTALSAGGLGILLIGAVQSGIMLFRKAPVQEILSGLLLLLVYSGIAVAMIAVMFPLLYKFGTNRSRLIILLVFFVPVMLVFAAVKLLPAGTLEGIALPPSFLQTLPYFLAAILLLGLWLSISLSIRICKSKEY